MSSAYFPTARLRAWLPGDSRHHPRGDKIYRILAEPEAPTLIALTSDKLKSRRGKRMLARSRRNWSLEEQVSRVPPPARCGRAVAALEALWRRDRTQVIMEGRARIEAPGAALRLSCARPRNPRVGWAAASPFRTRKPVDASERSGRQIWWDDVADLRIELTRCPVVLEAAARHAGSSDRVARPRAGLRAGVEHARTLLVTIFEYAARVSFSPTTFTLFAWAARALPHSGDHATWEPAARKQQMLRACMPPGRRLVTDSPVTGQEIVLVTSSPGSKPEGRVPRLNALGANAGAVQGPLSPLRGDFLTLR